MMEFEVVYPPHVQAELDAFYKAEALKGLRDHLVEEESVEEVDTLVYLAEGLYITPSGNLVEM